MNPKLIRITTVPGSIRSLLKGQLRFMSDNGFEVVAISSNIERHIKEIEETEGVRTVTVEMTRSLSLFKDILAVYSLYRVFRKEKPLIVHTHTPKAGTIGMLSAKLAGVPYRLHTVAGLPLLLARGPRRKLLDFVEKMTYSWATKVYPNSYGLYNIILENNYTSEKKLKVIGNGSSNGIDTTYFRREEISDTQKKELKDSLGIMPDDFVYLFVGRIVKAKGINELINAFSEINKKHNNTKLILVGVFEKHLDPLEPETEKVIRENNSIISVGYQRDVRPYFAIADVFVLPTHREGFPNVLMQACAMGVPSIATDINGCNEIIQHGTNGIIVPPHDSDALLEKMLYLHKMTEERKGIAERSRKSITDNYERRYVWGEILNEYHAVINKS